MDTKVEVTGQPITTPSTSEAIQQAPTAPTAHYLLLPQHPSKLHLKALQQQLTSSG